MFSIDKSRILKNGQGYYCNNKNIYSLEYNHSCVENFFLFVFLPIIIDKIILQIDFLDK